MSRPRTTQNTTQTQNSSQSGQYSGGQASEQSGQFAGSTADEFSNQSSSLFDFLSPPDSEDATALRGWRPQVDPSIQYRFNRLRSRMGERFNNPLGGYTTQAMRDAIERDNDLSLTQEEGAATGAAQAQNNQARLGQLTSLAGLTAPQLRQTGQSASGSSSNTSSGTSSGSSSGVSAGNSAGNSSGTSSGTSVTTQPSTGLDSALGLAGTIGQAAIL